MNLMVLKMTHNLGRLGWRSRRGMWELDQLLVPFASNELPRLSSQEQQSFERLLAFEDPTLYAWFLKGLIPEDSHIEALIHKILAYHHR